MRELLIDFVPCCPSKSDQANLRKRAIEGDFDMTTPPASADPLPDGDTITIHCEYTLADLREAIKAPSGGIF